MGKGNFTLEQPWRQDLTSQQDDKASEQNKYIIALASTHGALQPGKSLGLTVAKTASIARTAVNGLVDTFCGLPLSSPGMCVT